MNKSKIVFLIFINLFLLSCTNEKSIEELIEKKDAKGLIEIRVELAAKQTELSKKIQTINDALQQINPSKEKFVTLFVVKDSIFNHFIEQQGVVEATNSGGISPESTGILRLYVKEGSKVRKGAILGKIEDNGTVERLKQAQINLDLVKTQTEFAEVTFKKQEKLWQQKIGSEISFLQAQTNYKTALQNLENAKKQVELAQVQMRNQNIVAPYDGVVEKLYAKSGQFVSPQPQGILELVGSSSIKVTAKLPEKFLSFVRIGTPVLVEIPSVGKTFQSKISLIGSSVDPANRTFKVEIPITDKENIVKPNLVAKIKINDYSNKNTVAIPTSLVLDDANEESYVLTTIFDKQKNKRKVKKQVIKKGLDFDGMLEVKSGLSIGDSIVNQGKEKVMEEDFVQIIE